MRNSRDFDSYATIVRGFMIVCDNNKELHAGPVDKTVPGFYRMRLSDIKVVFDPILLTDHEYYVKVMVGVHQLTFKDATARAFMVCWDAWRLREETNEVSEPEQEQ